MSNVGPLEVGYFIHLEYKAKVSPADHMPSLYGRARTHGEPFVHPRALAVQAAAAHIWYVVARVTRRMCMCVRACVCVQRRAYASAYVYGDNVQSNLA